MATVLLYLEIVVAIFVCLLFLCCWRWINKTSPAINWPILGMLPDLLLNVSDVHNFVTRVLKYYGGTFVFKGPCFTDFNFVLTSDPMNVHHICSKNFSNYGKGASSKRFLILWEKGFSVLNLTHGNIKGS